MIHIYEVKTNRSGRVRSTLIDGGPQWQIEQKLDFYKNSESAKTGGIYKEIVFCTACLLPVDPNLNSGWSNTSPEEIFGDWTLDNHPMYAD